MAHDETAARRLLSRQTTESHLKISDLHVEFKRQLDAMDLRDVGLLQDVGNSCVLFGMDTIKIDDAFSLPRLFSHADDSMFDRFWKSCLRKGVERRSTAQCV